MQCNIVFRTALCTLILSVFAFAAWSIQQSGTTTRLRDVDFVNSNYGWAVGGVGYAASGIILHTSDGGTNWIDQTPNNIPGGIDVLHSVSFVDINTGWACGCDTFKCSLILKTTDGGTTWFRQTAPIDTPWVVSVHFRDVNNGWLSHGGPYGASYQQVILHTTNGGNSYSMQGWSNYDGGTSRLFFSSLQYGWVAGGTEMTPTTRGYIMRTTNGGANWSQSYNWGAVIPFTWPIMTAVHFPVDNSNGWACGWLAGFAPEDYEMRIVRTTNSGNNWSIQLTADTSISPSMDIHFVDLQNGWVVCFDGQILHTADGGNNWQFDSSGVNADLYGVDFVNLTNGWAVGSGGTILYYNVVGIKEETIVSDAVFDLILIPQNNEIIFSIISPKACKITLSLYNTLGQKIISEKKNILSGISRHKLSRSENLTNGVYFLKAEMFSQSIVKKLTLIK